MTVIACAVGNVGAGLVPAPDVRIPVVQAPGAVVVPGATKRATTGLPLHRVRMNEGSWTRWRCISTGTAAVIERTAGLLGGL